jgi:hypothetical protein
MATSGVSASWKPASSALALITQKRIIAKFNSVFIRKRGNYRFLAHHSVEKDRVNSIFSVGASAATTTAAGWAGWHTYDMVSDHHRATIITLRAVTAPPPSGCWAPAPTNASRVETSTSPWRAWGPRDSTSSWAS